MADLHLLLTTNWPALLLAGVVTTTGCLLIVNTQRWHGAHTLDSDEGVQKFHESPTPRVGGASIFAGLLVAWSAPCTAAELQAHQMLGVILVSGVPAFAFGLVEDLTKRVSVIVRLLATMASGVAAWYLTGYSLRRLDLDILDQLLKFLPVSVAFSAFAVGGVANAVNIIDGFNGLASTFSVLAFVGLALIAQTVGDTDLVIVCVLFALSVLGFLVVNWPLGKIFLGDGGSYFIGFALAWLCVLLTQRHADVSAFVALLICVHPITEVLFSILRRTIKKTHPGQPDRLHLHSLLKARYVRRWFKGRSMTYQNSATGLLVGGFSLIPVTIAQFVYNSTRWSVVAVFVFVCIYIALYARMVRFRWTSPVSFLFKRRR